MRKESDANPLVNCLICKEDKQFVSIGVCDHHRVCSYCTMKSRLLYSETKCPICNANLEYVYIVDFKEKKPFAELDKEKDSYYEDDEFEKSGIYFTDIEAKEEALQLRGFNCPVSNCKSEAFENLQSLSTHLNKAHKRFYCDCCLKNNKKFLSEMEIYKENVLDEHIRYGEYDKDILVSPPHPQCPFDQERFYNDEVMFNHMNNTHFICQLCKGQKHLVFYSNLSDLQNHYKSNHYCCPYEECLQDIYVAFEKEEELISHLITKHKVTNANDRLAQLMFEKKGKNSSDNKVYHTKGEFDFTEYISGLKEESEKYNKNVVSRRNRYVNKEETRIGEDGIEYIIKNEYDNYGGYNKYDNRGNGRRGRGRGGRGKGDRGRGRGGRYNNNNEYYNSNKYNEENTQYYGKKGRYNNKENNNREYKSYENKGNVYDNRNYNNKGPSPKKESPKNQKQPTRSLDYSFIFNFYLKSIKEYIKNKIIKEKIPDTQINLPKETIYQLIIVIDKMESFQKLLELTFLHNFGIDMEINKELRELTCEGSCNETSFYKILDKLPIKKVLIIYKYILISSKKVDVLFYKLDLEQINPDLYEDFLERPQKEEIKKDKFSKAKRDRYIQMKSEFNELGKTTQQPKKEHSSKLDGLLNPTEEDIKEEQKRKAEAFAKRSNLSKLLDGGIIEGKASKKVSGGTFKMSNFDLDEDFPALE